MKFTVKTEGFLEMDKALAEFTKATARNIMRRAASAGAEVIGERARELAPVSKPNGGALRDSIEVTTKLAPRAKGMTRKASEVEVYVGPTDDVRYRAHFIEFGTAPGKRGGRAASRQTDVKQAVGGRRVYRSHPGNKPQPFMRPAFDEKHVEALDATADALRVEMNKAADRARRKALKAKG